MKVILTVTKGPHRGRVFVFQEHDNFIVGRAKCAHFRLPVKDKYFSRVHFMIEINPPRCRLMDLGSTNGTRVNGRKVATVDLVDGDRIKGGETVIRVSIEGTDSDPLTGPESIPSQHTMMSQEASPPPEAEDFPPPRPVRPQTFSSLFWPSHGSASSGCRVCGRPVSAAQGSAAILCPECQDQVRSNRSPIAGYQIVRELGRGGMGIVFLALCEVTGARVALKMITPKVAPSKNESSRFLREADILRALDHPNIVAFHDVGESNGKFYFAMEYVPGNDLSRLLENYGGPLPIDRAVGITCQLLEALEYAHARGFVHRDIKPSNLLAVDTGGRDVVRLADFGLARAYQASRISGLTMTGDTRGTPAFMPPEQITHYRQVQPASDLYAVGATLYNLLTDRFIFNFPSRPDLMFRMILEDDPVPIRSRRAEIPEGLAAVIHRSLAKEPRARYPDADAMRQALVMSL